MQRRALVMTMALLASAGSVGRASSQNDTMAAPVRLDALSRTGPKTGQGVLVRGAGGICLLATVDHVLGGALTAKTTFDNGTPGNASRVFQNSGMDAAVLRPAQEVARCASPPTTARADALIAKALSQAATTSVTVLQLTPPARTVSVAARVLSRDAEHITIEALQAGSGRLMEGSSGGPVLIDGVLVGLIQGVDPGEGVRVLRLDYLARTAVDGALLGGSAGAAPGGRAAAPSGPAGPSLSASQLMNAFGYGAPAAPSAPAASQPPPGFGGAARPAAVASGPPVLDMTYKRFMVSEFLDINGKKEARQGFVLTQACQLAVTTTANSDVRWAVLSDRDTPLRVTTAATRTTPARIDLAAGTYVFRVQAVRNAGQYSWDLVTYC